MKKRVLVCIISKQTIPNYLFIKDKQMERDEMLFIATQEMKNEADWLIQTLKCTEEEKQAILLAKNQEEKWNEMTAAIAAYLNCEKHYVVNLTGGTKYMSLAVYHLFCDYDSEFYYIPFPRNIVLKPFLDKKEEIKYRMKIPEYLSLFGLQFNELKRETVRDETYTEHFFHMFCEKLSPNDFEIINKIREVYRNTGIKNIEDVENSINLSGKKVAIPGLINFLEKIAFHHTDNALSIDETRYLTGGWFEEYVFNKIKKDIPTTDIALGVKLGKEGTFFKNDLDVVFSYENHLFVIECKTGIDSNRVFNEIVYKASAIKESMFGLPAHTYIFALHKDDEQLDKVAKSMNITYFGKSYFTEPDKWNEIVEQIINITKR